MSTAYDLYQPGQSWLHRLDPRAKLLLALCGAGVLLTLRNVWLVAGALALTQGALWSARIAGDRLGWVWRVAGPTMAIIFVLSALFSPGDAAPLLELGPLRVTGPGLALGAAVALRLGALALLAFLWLFTTDQSSLVRSLTQLGLPHAWSLTLAIALSYLPVMAGSFRTIAEAQQARALDLAPKGLVRRTRAYLPIAVAMVISAFRTADALGRTLESRAFGAAGVRRTSYRQLRLRSSDWIVLALTLGLTALALWARYAWGWGADPLRLW